MLASVVKVCALERQLFGCFELMKEDPPKQALLF